MNALGEALTVTDRNGTVHALTRDPLGRVVSDEVTAFGAGVDQSVSKITTAYDGQGNAYLITSYDPFSAVVNEVQREFNGLGQLVTEWQQHGAAVNTSTSPKIQYGYSNMPSGANHSRLTSVTYPSGYVLTYNYTSGLDSDISRLSSLSDGTGTLEAYSYLGLGTVVVRSHPQITLDQTFIGTPASAGDQYAGLDLFGRVEGVLWVDTSGPTVTDQFGYTYDAAGNRLTRANGLNGSFDETYTYDDLDQLTNFARGLHTQDFDYDALGNFEGVDTDGAGAVARTHNAQNEITSVAGATTPAFDANGNMTGDETGRTFVFDAWNRLVEVKSGVTVLKTYRYDGLNRRVSDDDGLAVRDLYYSASWQVLEEQVGGAEDVRYVWSPVYVDALVLRDRNADANMLNGLEERLWVQQDANWNVTALVDALGAVVERYVYDVYGVRSVLDASWSPLGSSAYGFNHGFQGMAFDDVAGLSHQRARWYSPTLGRWVSVDPIRFGAGSVLLFGFVGNRPTSAIDPSGLLEQPLPLANPATQVGIGVLILQGGTAVALGATVAVAVVPHVLVPEAPIFPSNGGFGWHHTPPGADAPLTQLTNAAGRAWQEQWASFRLLWDGKPYTGGVNLPRDLTLASPLLMSQPVPDAPADFIGPLLPGQKRSNSQPQAGGANGGNGPGAPPRDPNAPDPCERDRNLIRGFLSGGQGDIAAYQHEELIIRIELTAGRVPTAQQIKDYNDAALGYNQRLGQLREARNRMVANKCNDIPPVPDDSPILK